VAGINDNLTYRYDANGNMTAMYDTAKQFNRILYWDDDNRLAKTVDTASGASVPTQYHYDAKGMRIVKEGPYGKSIYIDTGYVESGAIQTAPIVSNHIFVGNTRVASVVKHTEEKNPATYYYASDHLGSSSVLTTQTGSYHERIEYLPYGETWVEDKATSDSYTTPYKFTGKELDAETGLYYFGARYYDARISRWISTDPAFQKFLPTGDKQHDDNLPAGGVFKPSNLGMYVYTSNNPLMYIDPDGQWDERIHRGSEKKGTLRWAQDVGFSNTEANRIAAACNNVDSIMSGLSFLPMLGNQGYHFNTNAGGIDSRILNAIGHLNKAIGYENMANKFRNDDGGIMGWMKNTIADVFHNAALDELGKGLHPLQDVYAHTDDLTKEVNFLGISLFKYHDSPQLNGKPNKADDPREGRGRVNATEQATKAFLEFFKKMVEE